jgi:hypothetical protein
MNNKEDNRRTFLKSLLAGSAAVVGTATAAGPSRAAVEKKRPAPAGRETLYRETDEFKRYYQSLEY